MTTTSSSEGATRHERPSRREQRHPALQRGTLLAVASVVVPPLAWLTALVLSYGTQDFTCSIFESAARPGPGGAVLVLVLVGNALLLVLTVLAGWAGWRQWRTGRRTERFLGLVGVGAMPFFALGIVLIALPPLFLEVCP